MSLCDDGREFRRDDRQQTFRAALFVMAARGGRDALHAAVDTFLPVVAAAVGQLTIVDNLIRRHRHDVDDFAGLLVMRLQFERREVKPRDIN